MEKKVGPPVRGDAFFDRKHELAVIWEQLETENILLLAPRRVGKTSLMWRLLDTSAKHGFQSVYCNVEGATNEREFLNELVVGIHKADSQRTRAGDLVDGLTDFIKKRVAKVGPIELTEAAQEHWSTVGETVANQLARDERRWLLLVDELPVFITRLVNGGDSVGRARDFLHWFRRLRLGPYERDNIRWLLAGSIGLDTVAARLELGDSINDLSLRGLGAFPDREANAFLVELARSYQVSLSAVTRRHILARIGWPIPYYLQLVFSELLELHRREGCPLGKAAVDRVFDDLLRPEKKGYFDYWRQRLGEELGRPDGALAAELLLSIAKSSTGATPRSLAARLSRHVPDPDERDRKLRYLTDVLVADGYVVQASGRYRFRSPLLREFWIRRVKS